MQPSDLMNMHVDTVSDVLKALVTPAPAGAEAAAT